MELVGKVIAILPPISGKSVKGEWQKQDVVFEQVDASSKFTRKALITFFNRPQDVAMLKVGKTYTVSFDIDAREFNGKWFSDIKAWRVSLKDQPQDNMPPMPEVEPLETVGDYNDVPF